MNQNTIITVGLLIVGLFVGYLLGSNYPIAEVLQQEGVVSTPTVSLVQEWRGSAAGEVVEISSRAITISFDEQTLVISFADELNVSKAIVFDNEVQETVEDLTVDDIKVGSVVALTVIADSQGNISTNSISFTEAQQ